jgi:hypothetical protein
VLTAGTPTGRPVGAGSAFFFDVSILHSPASAVGKDSR